jgi:hypothetical protein
METLEDSRELQKGDSSAAGARSKWNFEAKDGPEVKLRAPAEHPKSRSQ